MGLRNFTIIGRKIIGLDAKYVKHVNERAEIFAGAERFLFLKPTSSYVAEPKAIRLPANFDAKCAGIFVWITTIIAIVVTLGIIIGKEGSNICSSRALEHIGGFVLALDVALNLSHVDKSVARSLDTFCPIS
jgi:acylpyruvate hydrolase